MTNSFTTPFVTIIVASSLVAGLQSTDSPNNEIAPGDQDIAIFGLSAVTNATGTERTPHSLDPYHLCR